MTVSNCKALAVALLALAAPCLAENVYPTLHYNPYSTSPTPYRPNLYPSGALTYTPPYVAPRVPPTPGYTPLRPGPEVTYTQRYTDNAINSIKASPGYSQTSPDVQGLINRWESSNAATDARLYNQYHQSNQFLQSQAAMYNAVRARSTPLPQSTGAYFPNYPGRR